MAMIRNLLMMFGFLAIAYFSFTYLEGKHWKFPEIELFKSNPVESPPPQAPVAPKTHKSRQENVTSLADFLSWNTFFASVLLPTVACFFAYQLRWRKKKAPSLGDEIQRVILAKNPSKSFLVHDLNDIIRKQVNCQHAMDNRKRLEREKEKFNFHGSWSKLHSEINKVELQRVELEVKFLQLEEEYAMLSIETKNLRSQLVSPSQSDSFPSAANYLTLATKKEDEYKAKIEQLRLMKTNFQIELLRAKASTEKEVQNWKNRIEQLLTEHKVKMGLKEDAINTLEYQLMQTAALRERDETSKKEEIKLLNDSINRLNCDKLCERRDYERQVDELVQSNELVSASYALQLKGAIQTIEELRLQSGERDTLAQECRRAQESLRVSEDQKRTALAKLESFKNLLGNKSKDAMEKTREENKTDSKLDTSRKYRRTHHTLTDSNSSIENSSSNSSPRSQSIWGPVNDSPFGHIPSPPEPDRDSDGVDGLEAGLSFDTSDGIESNIGAYQGEETLTEILLRDEKGELRIDTDARDQTIGRKHSGTQ